MLHACSAAAKMSYDRERERDYIDDHPRKSFREGDCDRLCMRGNWDASITALQSLILGSFLQLARCFLPPLLLAAAGRGPILAWTRRKRSLLLLLLRVGVHHEEASSSPCSVGFLAHYALCRRCC
jgi:hypothetical protein